MSAVGPRTGGHLLLAQQLAFEELKPLHELQPELGFVLVRRLNRLVIEWECLWYLLRKTQHSQLNVVLAPAVMAACQQLNFTYFMLMDASDVIAVEPRIKVAGSLHDGLYFLLFSFTVGCAAKQMACCAIQQLTTVSTAHWPGCAEPRTGCVS
jgi:hypothetical protein